MLCLTNNAPTPDLPTRHVYLNSACCFDLVIDLTADSNALHQNAQICLYDLVDWPSAYKIASAYVDDRLHRGRAPTPWPSAYTVAECLRRGRALFYWPRAIGSGTDQNVLSFPLRHPKSS